MEAIRFVLEGVGATFKRPHINSINQTYSHIHKVALLGIFGAILGYGGHIQYAEEIKALPKKRKEKVLPNSPFPEFYNKLKGLQIAIVPFSPKFAKQTEHKVETTGFFNDGFSFMLKEDFLINPKWEIYVSQGDVEEYIYTSLKDALLRGESHYETYLGRNHYPAVWSDVEVRQLNEVLYPEHIDSLFPSESFEIEDSFDIETDWYRYSEYMPVKYRPYLNHYIEKELSWTNEEISPIENVSSMIYESENRFLCFL